ncbi:Girdin isoform 2 [Dirofilaria immitis]|nr:Girdin isoform 2 [Dirofilaria immitis]
MLQLDTNHKQKEEDRFWNKPLGAWIKDCISGSDALLPESTWRAEAFHGRVLRFSELCDDDCEADVNNVLLLLLGCAVQGEQRDKFIERIKRMENELQTALINQIKKIAEEGDCVLNLQLISENDQITTILTHLENVMKERDRYANRLYEMCSERANDENSMTIDMTTDPLSISSEMIKTTKQSETRCEDCIPSASARERHTNVELASAKAELRKLRNMMEERDEIIAELKDEAEAREVNILKMQQERLELVKDARAAKDYRDELEYLQHKLANYDKLETDNGKLKEKLSELDFSNLEEENELMQESCSVLENQLEQCKRKVSNHMDMEAKLADYQDQITQYLTDITKGIKKEQQKNLILERKVECMNEEEHSSREDFGSLGSQIADDNKKRILELELENRKLKTKLENTEIVEKNKECEILDQQVQEFQMTLSQVTLQYQKACDLCNTLVMERDLAQQNLQEARKKFSDFQKDFQHELKSDVLKRNQGLTEEAENNKVSELPETLKAKEEIINCLRENQLHQAEQIACNLEKQKKLLENERNTQKAISKQFEERIEQNRLQMMDMENIQKKLEACERALMESRSRVNELESENRQLNQQLELEFKKMDRLREDLIAAKSRCSDLISRLHSICVSIQLNGGKCEMQMVQSIDDNGDDDDYDDKIFTVINDVIIKALAAARREADALKLQQHAQIAELNDLKEDIDRLRIQALIIYLKHSENSLKVFLLQERIREMQQENSLKCGEVASLKRELEELQYNSANRSKLHRELAKLQVSVRNFQLQEELLRQDNAEMQKQIKIYEEEKLATKTDFESLQAMHSALLIDHDRLQTLNDMLNTDYDRAKYDNTLLNIKLNNHKELKLTLVEEREQHNNEIRLMRNDMIALRNSYEQMWKDNDSLMRNAELSQNELRKLRFTEQNQRAISERLTIQIDDLQQKLQAQNLEIAELLQKIELFAHLNKTLNEENQNLDQQLNHLLTQNQDLIDRTLNDKDNFYNAQKDFQEKLTLQETLSSLRSHKEQLEDKIMERCDMLNNKK